MGFESEMSEVSPTNRRGGRELGPALQPITEEVGGTLAGSLNFIDERGQ